MLLCFYTCINAWRKKVSWIGSLKTWSVQEIELWEQKKEKRKKQEKKKKNYLSTSSSVPELLASLLASPQCVAPLTTTPVGFALGGLKYGNLMVQLRWRWAMSLFSEWCNPSEETWVESAWAVDGFIEAVSGSSGTDCPFIVCEV